MLFEGLDTGCSFEQFVEMYQDSTHDPFNFLYVDWREETFRRNFDREDLIKHSESFFSVVMYNNAN